MNSVFILNEKDFEIIYNDMLNQFPKCELKTFDFFLKLFNSSNYKCELFKINNQNIGYVSYYLSDFIWVDYLAVFKNFQSKGFGTQILNCLFNKYKNLNGAYFEVELENEKDLNSQKRMQFYKKKIKCIETNTKYFLPNNFELFEMKLLYKPLNLKSLDNEMILNNIKETFSVLYSYITNVEEIYDKIKHHLLM